MKRCVIAIAIVLACAGIMLSINKGGQAARHIEKSSNLSSERPTIYLLNNTPDVYRLWEKKKVHGRIVVHLGKFLHYVQPELERDYTVPHSNYPLKIQGPHEFTVNEVNYRNFLWIAMDSGAIRKTYNVIPLPDFQDRFNLRTSNMTPVDVIENDYASARIMTTRLPSVREPVLLNIDASFFGKVDAAEVERMLRSSGLSADVVTVCLAKDSPDVREEERIKANEFVRKISEFASIVVSENNI